MAEYANDGTSVAERHYSQDHLGSTRGTYDELGSYIGGVEYTPYGKTLFSTMPTDITRGFTGHHLDGMTNQYFAPFRYYDPSTARWLKRDPLGMIDGPNMYAYVGGNPANYLDPWGFDRVNGIDSILDGGNIPNTAGGLPRGSYEARQAGDAGLTIAVEGTKLVRDTAATEVAGAGLLGFLGKGLARLAQVCGIGKKAKPAAKALGADALPSLKDLKKLSNKEVKNIAVHSKEVKGFNSRQDLYKDAKGNIFVGNKGGGGFGDPLNINIRNLLGK